jgi:hypothetical protein
MVGTACSGDADAPEDNPVIERAPAPAAAPKPPPPTVFTIAASGDLLAHGPVTARAAQYGREAGQAYDFKPMLAPVEPVVAGADLGICHLETPLSPDNRNLSSYPIFNVSRAGPSPTSPPPPGSTTSRCRPTSPGW